MHPAYEDILVDTPATYVARITLNRPERKNALSTRLLREVAQALGAFDADEGVRCVILTGGPDVFAAGADIKEMADPGDARAAFDERQGYWQTIRDFPKPLIAAVSGYCLGGGNELAMLCDIIVAGEDAQFGQPEIKLALTPGAGGTQRLTAAMGKAKAMKHILTGEFLGATEALMSGLVSEVHTSPLGRALELAETIAAKSPVAVRLAKEAVRNAAVSYLKDGFAMEHDAFATLLTTDDRREGIAAFLEKRQPEFKGR